MHTRRPPLGRELLPCGHGMFFEDGPLILTLAPRLFQDWANSQGGLVAALAHPAMPAAGTPLRAAVEAALRQQIETGIPYDAGFDDWFEDEEVYGGVYAEDPSKGALGRLGC